MAQFPSLNALRLFEIVARNGSFKRAADDLYVTQSAVSQQMKQLEEQLGHKLFLREPGRLKLTASGELLLPAVTRAIGLIGDALEKMSSGQQVVRVHTSTSFATRWLMPRFATFESEFPNLDVRISVGDRPDLTIDVIDLEVAYFFAPPVSGEGEHLLDEWVLPVCAPNHPAASLSTVEGLIDHRLLLNSQDGKDWRIWARKMGFETEFKSALQNALKLSTDTAAIELALSGFGVALVNLHYASQHISEGRLVPAVSVPPSKLGAHYLCAHSPPNVSIRLFQGWLINKAKEAEQMLASSHGLLQAP